MDIDSSEYKLRCELRGHEDDVRGICVCDDVGIATSSRDRTVRLWIPDPSDPRRFTAAKILLGHTSFVGPLAWVPPNEELPAGAIVSGSMDTQVIVWDMRTGEAVRTLKGHKMQVTGIALDGGDIVSSSVDCTLRRWRKGQLVEAWEGHKSPIQTVIKLPSGELATGSSDTSINLWNWKTNTKTLSGHTDTVRGLGVMADMGILSASHDGSIRLWALTGEVLLEMVGHTSIVYSVDSHESGLIVSGSEDRFAKIWQDGDCVQSIEHPGCVWDTKFLENGDIVTACSDGVVRIWTAHQDKIADTLDLESYASQLSQYKLSRKKVGGVKLEDLPGLEALQIPGSRDGQTKVVREGDNGVAYAWNMREQKWDKIGEVVDGPDDGAKLPVLDGVQYDYVFDVDIGDGEPIRKLPYNRSDSPYDTADKWLLKENLPVAYRQQIVDFILQNTGQKDFTFDPSFRDPFTGSSAYTPGDFFNKSAAPKPTFKHIPKKGMLVFDVASFDGILKKIMEFNHNLLNDEGLKELALSESECSRIFDLVKVLKDTSRYHSSKLADIDVAMLVRLLKSWPMDMMFPVVDMLRMLVLHPVGATMFLQHVQAENDILMEIVKKTSESTVTANLLTSLRLFTNLFKHSCYSDWLLRHRIEVLDAFSGCNSSSNKPVQLSYSTFLLNYSVLLIEKKDEGQSQVLSAALELAEQESLSVDSKFRVLVAIGSLMLDGQVKQLALDLDVESIAKAAKTSNESKIVEVGADIEQLVAKTS